MEQVHGKKKVLAAEINMNAITEGNIVLSRKREGNRSKEKKN